MVGDSEDVGQIVRDEMTATAVDFRPSINALTLRCSGTPSAAVA